LLGKTHQAPLEQAGQGMAGPLDQDGEHWLEDILQVVQDRQQAGKDTQLVGCGRLLADLGTQLIDWGTQQVGLDIQLRALLPGQVAPYKVQLCGPDVHLPVAQID